MNNVVAFVSGTDQHSAKPPQGFPFRSAVLTWFFAGHEQVEPWHLLRRTFPRISDLIGANTVIAEYWIRKRGGCLFPFFQDSFVKEVHWPELMQRDDDSLVQEDFPSRFRFLSDDDIVLLAECEMWNLVGGPSPYHDSVTISFFSATPIHEALFAIVTEEAQALGATIQNVQ